MHHVETGQAVKLSSCRSESAAIGINSHWKRSIHSCTNGYLSFRDAEFATSPVFRLENSDQAGNARPAFFVPVFDA